MRRRLDRKLVKLPYRRLLELAREQARKEGKAAPAEGSNVYVYEERGFALRCSPGNAHAYILDYRHGGRRRVATLARVEDLDLDDARQRAGAWRDQLRRGIDPAGEIAKKKAAPTVADLWARVEAEHLPGRSASTRRMYRDLFGRYIVPAIGDRRIEDVRRADVAAILAGLAARGKTVTRRHVNAVLSKSFKLAKLWGMLDESAPLPTAGQELPAPRRPGQALSDPQLAAIGRALDAEPAGSVAAVAFKVALLCGARLGEVCRRFKWDGLEHGGRVVRVQGKTGERRCYLGRPAAELIAALPRRGPWIFPGRKSGRPLQDVRALWDRLKARVELPAGHELPATFRAYDASRHTFVSACARLRIEEGRRQLLSGHKLPKGAHWSYYHLGPADLLPDADLVAEALARGLRGESFMPTAEGGQGADVIAFPARA